MRLFIHTTLAVALCAGLALAGPNDPIVGEKYESLVLAQHVFVQTAISDTFRDSQGYLVTGPLKGTAEKHHFHQTAIRVICPDVESLQEAIARMWESPDSAYKSTVVDLWEGMRGYERPDFCWASTQMSDSSGNQVDVIPITIQQCRFMIWARSDVEIPRDYRRAVSDYLHSLDTGWMEAPAPKAVDYGLPDSLDFYADPPDYVIEGYENYLNFLHGHDTIRLDFAYGLTEFIPSDSLWDAMKANAPQVAYPNKEWPMLQHEYKKFFERGGDVRVMQTLTREGFDTLKAGEYFFAVSVAGKVRFGRELLREEVNRIEAETGRKVPRANHAFLFPGEPVLTAGAFFIENTDDGHRLSHINAQSGHYFYSNVSPTIREDISERSDTYLLSLGHFFAALDSLGILHDNVVISKL